MAVNTLLLDFSVDTAQVKNENNVTILFTKVENILRDYLVNLKPVNSFHVESSSIKVYTSDLGTLTTLRIYNHGLLTINIEYYKSETQEPLISFEVSFCTCLNRYFSLRLLYISLAYLPELIMFSAF